jgi:hypothetical protein
MSEQSVTDWNKVAHTVMRRRRARDCDKAGVTNFDDLPSDKCVLIDCRPIRTREAQWTKFRSYLELWRCSILAELSTSDAGVMVIDCCGRDLLTRLRREFGLLRLLAEHTARQRPNA